MTNWSRRSVFRNLLIFGFFAVVFAMMTACGGGGGGSSRSPQPTQEEGMVRVTPPTVRVEPGTQPPSEPSITQIPSEPPRQGAPQASGGDVSGLTISGAGTTQYLYALNTGSQGWTIRAGTWFEPKDGQYQRMIVTRSTPIPTTGRVVQIPAACMQQENAVPASGARFFSQPKSVSGSVQQCQANCLSRDTSDIQGCVWNCQRSSSGDRQVSSSVRQIVFQTADTCNDGRGVSMRFSYQNNGAHVNWATSVLSAGGSDTVTRVSCNYSNVTHVCYGARLERRAGDTRTVYWGHDIDRTKSCPDCCIPCPSSGERRHTLNFGCPR